VKNKYGIDNVIHLRIALIKDRVMCSFFMVVNSYSFNLNITWVYLGIKFSLVKIDVKKIIFFLHSEVDTYYISGRFETRTFPATHAEGSSTITIRKYLWRAYHCPHFRNLSFTGTRAKCKCTFYGDVLSQFLCGSALIIAELAFVADKVQSDLVVSLAP